MMVESGASGNVELYWGTTSARGFSETRSARVPVIADGEYHTYYIPVTSHPGWTATLTDLRIDPFTSGINQRFYINWVRLHI